MVTIECKLLVQGVEHVFTKVLVVPTLSKGLLFELKAGPYSMLIRVSEIGVVSLQHLHLPIQVVCEVQDLSNPQDLSMIDYSLHNLEGWKRVPL